MTTLYLIRHGEAEGNLYRRMQGQYDSRITALGLRQIEALGLRFRDVPLEAVYSSDLCRAMETAAVLCRQRGLPLHTDPRLREIDVGPWEDRTFGDAAAENPLEMEQFTSRLTDFSLPGAERYSQVARRMEAVVREIAGRHPNGQVAIVSHSLSIGALLAALFFGLEHPEKAGRSTNTAVTKLTAAGNAFSLVYCHDASHLTEELSPAHPRASMHIRPMGEGAAEEYIRYRRDAWQVVYGSLEGFNGPGFWLDAQRTLGPDPWAMVVGELEGRPVGMLQLSPERDKGKGVGYIPFLYLREPFRHQGLGIQLIGHGVSFYRRLGRTKLQLSVAPTNENALGFYHKYGFHQVKKQRGRFGHLLLLEKDIAPPTPPNIPMIAQ